MSRNRHRPVRRRAPRYVQLPDRQSREPAWKGAGQLVVPQIQSLQAIQVLQRGGDRSGQPVASEVQFREAGQRAQRNRDRAGQRVVAQTHVQKIRQPSQLGRDRAAQRVSAESQDLKVRQCAQLGRDRAGQRVLAELQDPEVRQCPRLGRKLAAQRVADQPELRDTTARVGSHAVPVAQRRGVAQPVGAVRPARATGSMEERLEGRPVRFDAVLRAGGGRDPPQHGARHDQGHNGAGTASGHVGSPRQVAGNRITRIVRIRSWRHWWA